MDRIMYSDRYIVLHQSMDFWKDHSRHSRTYTVHYQHLSEFRTLRRPYDVKSEILGVHQVLVIRM